MLFVSTTFFLFFIVHCCVAWYQRDCSTDARMRAKNSNIKRKEKRNKRDATQTHSCHDDITKIFVYIQYTYAERFEFNDIYTYHANHSMTRVLRAWCHWNCSVRSASVHMGKFTTTVNRAVCLFNSVWFSVWMTQQSAARDIILEFTFSYKFSTIFLPVVSGNDNDYNYNSCHDSEPFARARHITHPAIGQSFKIASLFGLF